MEVNFSCTRCGRCCQNLKLTLTIEETAAWLSDGNNVEVLVEAIPWPDEPLDDDGPTNYKRDRSFPVMSGSLPTRVLVILAGSFSGSCPNLLPDMRCGIYHRRPSVCRIYPAETNPHIGLVLANKQCPPEAWSASSPSFMRSGKVVDANCQATIRQVNEEACHSVPIRERLCAILGIDSAALVSDGFVAYSPTPLDLSAALARALKEADQPASTRPWHYVSNRKRVVDVLKSSGASARLLQGTDVLPFGFIGFHHSSV